MWSNQSPRAGPLPAGGAEATSKLNARLCSRCACGVEGTLSLAREPWECLCQCLHWVPVTS